MSEPILLDTGMSERGWSWYGDAFRCLHLFALKRHGHSDSSEPLIRGTMGHIAMAQLHARWMMQQTGGDVHAYYEPEDGMRVWAERHQEGLPHLGRMLETFRRYLAAYPEPPGRILGVEMPIRSMLGTVEGQWGLWVLLPGAPGREWRAGQPRPRALIGPEIEPSTLQMPGHPDDGEPILVTRRLDLVIEDRARKVHVWDHKCIAAFPSKDRVKKYAMDAQFAVTRIMSAQLYGELLGQTSLNLVQTDNPHGVKRLPVPATPWRDSRFARDIYRQAHVIAQLQRDEPDPHNWPMAQHEQVCSSRYGDCPMMDACMYGRK